jgi:predicted membrane-bound spermidine synthase
MFWIIAALEGFSTLAVEVIAIRLAIPIVGSSMTLTGITLGIVLLALSVGYWRGGGLSARWERGRIRMRLAANLFAAAVLYGVVAFPWEARLLEELLERDFTLPVAIGLTAAALLLVPIYLASMTVPMLAELTNDEGKAGKASGRVLFFSTVGSVAGGIVTPVWLFPWLGVARSGHLVCWLLATAAAVMALGGARRSRSVGLGVAGLAAIVTAQALAAPAHDLFRFDSPYQTIRVMEEPGEGGRRERLLLMGGGRASGVWADTGETSFRHVKEAVQVVERVRPAEVLVIGAAGFNFPRDISGFDYVRRVDAIDIDPAMKDIAERHFLRAPLSNKIRFQPLSARYAVRRFCAEGRHYRLAMVDAYLGRGIPEELVTREFFADLNRVADQTIANVILDHDLETRFANNLLSTYARAFGGVWVKDTHPGGTTFSNYLVSSRPVEGAARWTGSGTIYSDDRNAGSRDFVSMLWNVE